MRALPHPNGKTSFLVRAALAAALLGFAEPALAERQCTDVTASGDLKFFNSNGTDYGDVYEAMERLTDDNLNTGVIISTARTYFILDFSDAWGGDANHLMYVKDITIGHLETRKYSLAVSEDGTTWTDIATEVETSGEEQYDVNARIKAVKYTFVRGTNTDNTLCEFHVSGYVSSVPKNIVYKQQALAKLYYPDGTMTEDNGTTGFSGGAGLSHWFDGNKNTSGGLWDGGGGTWLGNLGNGGWCIVAVSNAFPEGCFVTDISVSQCSDFKYSLYWLDEDGWHSVPDAIEVSRVGEGIYDVNQIAKAIKIFFNQTGGKTVNIAEIEIWGMTADDVFCMHPSYTEWTYVEGSAASCLAPGIEERFCTVCGARFTREQSEPMGHDFVSHLLVRGAYRKFGSGYIDCSRCDWRLDFPLDPNNPLNTMPLDLVTNRVNGTQIGAIYTKGQVHFTEISVTTTGNGADEPDASQNWGVNPHALIDNHWDWEWQHYWYSIRSSIDPDPHVDYIFGTEMDLAWVDLSTDKGSYTNLLLSVDDTTGEETLLATSSAFSDNESATTIVRLRFYEQPIKHLRLRQVNADGSIRAPMKVSELRPWGTVKGAGDKAERKETLIIFR